MENDRTNFSKNETLFPIFDLVGAPSWCMVQVMVCTKWWHQHDLNTGEALVGVPGHVSECCPVEPKFALSTGTSHIAETAMAVFDSTMLTCGNSDVCSGPLHNAINKAHLNKLRHSTHHPTAPASAVPKKTGNSLSCFLHLVTLCETSVTRLQLLTLTNGVQSVTRSGTLMRSKGFAVNAQDCTFQVVKNHRKSTAKALWDVATETGETATAVLVPTTKT